MRAFAPSDLTSAEDDLREMLGDMHQSSESRGRFFVSAYVLISAGAGVGGYCLHQTALDAASSFLSLSQNSNNFETSFFSLLSFVYGLFSGQTFLFLYERQVNVLQELYAEVFALENLIQLTFATCADADLRVKMANALQSYVRSEIYDPAEMSSPFDEDGPYMQVLDTISLLSDQSIPITDLVEAAKRLADAQSRRSAVASQILPDVHYLFMLVQALAIVVSFLVFDYTETSGGGVEERRLLFGSLISFLTLTNIVLFDLSDPLHGLYSFRSNLDKRVGLLAKAHKALKTRDCEFVPGAVKTLSKLGIVSFSSSGGGQKTRKKRWSFWN